MLFQPYIDLNEGWNPARLSDQAYRATGRLQADVVLAAADQLMEAKK